MTIQLEDFIGGKVELLMPHQVKGLELVNATKTSLSFKWNKSKSPDVVMYNIYVDGVLAGGTQALTHEVSELTEATDYVLEVKAVRKNGEESHPTTLKVKTLGNYFLSMPGKDNNYVQAPVIKFDAVELIAELRPKANNWGNFLIHSMTAPPKEYAVATQFNGATFFRNGFDEMYADNVLYTDRYNAKIPLNQKISLRAENKVVEAVESLRFFGSRAEKSVSTFAGSLYRIRYYKRDDLSRLVLVSDYDFTYQAEGKVEDMLGNNEPLVIVGADAKFEINGGA